MFHVEHFAEDDFHTIKKANAMRWPFLLWASYLVSMGILSVMATLGGIRVPRGTWAP
jgi:hypothetical protein